MAGDVHGVVEEVGVGDAEPLPRSLRCMLILLEWLYLRADEAEVGGILEELWVVSPIHSEDPHLLLTDSLCM